MRIVSSFRNLWKYRFLVSELVRREIKSKYKRSILGILWSVLNPLLMMLILNVIFSDFFKVEIPNYLVYYLTGSLLFNFLTEASSGALFSIFTNSGLINKVYIPKYIFPVAKTISAFTNFLFALIALCIVAIFSGISGSISIFATPLLFLMLFMFVLGISLIFATFTVFFRDLIHFHGIFMMMWMWVTPIFYPVKILEEKSVLFLKLNPMYYYISYFRKVILDHQIPDLNHHLCCFFIGLFSLCIGLLAFKKNQDKFALYF